MSKLFDRFKGAIDGSPEDEEMMAPAEEAMPAGEESEMVEDEDKVEKVKSIIASVADKLTPEEKDALEAAVADLAVQPAGDEEVVEEKVEEEVPVVDEEPLDAAEAVAKAEEGQEDAPVEEPVEAAAPEAEPEAMPEEAPVEDEEQNDEFKMGYMKKSAEAVGMDADDDNFKAAFEEGVKYGLHHAMHHQKEGSEVEPEFKGATDAKLAMDAAIKKAKAESLKHFRALSNAAQEVRSVLGNVDALAFDSADDIYGAALKRAGIDLAGHPKSAYRSMFAVMGKKTSVRVAQDEASTRYSGAFAGLNRIKH